MVGLRRAVYGRFGLAALLACVALLSVATASCGSGEGGETAGNPETGEVAGQSDNDGGGDMEGTDAVTDEAEAKTLNPIATIDVRDFGVMRLELFPEVAPNTVANFIYLADRGFYDGLTFHRISGGFVVQGGDPDGNGGGGPGYTIKGEFASNGFPNGLNHKKGVISMARVQRDNDSAGSQFFIMLSDVKDLDGGYAAFGILVEGYDVLEALGEVECHARGYGDEPISPPVIASVTVDVRGAEYPDPEMIG